MLSPATLAMLNEQINLEFFSSNVYLQMSAWCDNEGLEGCAGFLDLHADEEMAHMKRIWTYVNEAGEMAKLGALEEPPTSFESIADLFEQVYKHEQHVTASINKIAQAAFAEPDMTTFNFMQWFVAEQHEEEALVRTILDKIKIIGLEGKGLYFIDQEIGKLAEKEMAGGEDTAT
jgi:ferritin